MAHNSSFLPSTLNGNNHKELAFPIFTELPKEIQETIWENALFDPNRINETPGIHFFNTYAIPEVGGRTWKYLKHHASIERQRNGYGYYMAGVCDKTGHSYGPTHPAYSNFAVPRPEANDSAYLTNALLWRTSVDARNAVRRLLKKTAMQTPRIAVSPTMFHKDSPEKTEEHPAAALWYEWDPAIDLVCVRPIKSPRDQRASLEDLAAYELHRDCNFFYTFKMPGYTSLALEYDPRWNPGTTDLESKKAWRFGDSEPLKDIQAWVTQLRRSGKYNKEFYFIDYRLKPRHGLSIHDLGKPAFQGRNGSYYLADVTGGNFGIPAVADIVPSMRRARTNHSGKSGHLDVLEGSNEDMRNLYKFLEYISWDSADNIATLDVGIRFRLLARVIPGDNGT